MCETLMAGSHAASVLKLHLDITPVNLDNLSYTELMIPDEDKTHI